MTHEVEGSHAALPPRPSSRAGTESRRPSATPSRRITTRCSRRRSRRCSLIAADAISASRPGARGESLESYIRRLKSLEELAKQKRGVEKVYALQAGREIRVMVKPSEVDDYGAVLLSHEIAREIQDQLEYPGQVKVTVIRESRAVDVARNVNSHGEHHHAAAPAPPDAAAAPERGADAA